MTETKAQFKKRESDWLAAIDAAPSNQRDRVLRLFNEERLAHGLKAVHDA